MIGGFHNLGCNSYNINFFSNQMFQHVMNPRSVFVIADNKPFRASTALLRNVCMSPLWEDKFADNFITM